MKYLKTVKVQEAITPAIYFRKLRINHFRRISSDRISIDEITYNIWKFSWNGAEYVATFPIQDINHFHLFSLSKEDKVVRYLFRKENSLDDLIKRGLLYN